MDGGECVLVVVVVVVGGSGGGGGCGCGGRGGGGQSAGSMAKDKELNFEEFKQFVKDKEELGTAKMDPNDFTEPKLVRGRSDEEARAR